MSAPSRANPTVETSPIDAHAAGSGRQELFQQVNEAIRRIADSFAVKGSLELVCECARGDCFERLSLSRCEYEAVRRLPNRFLIRFDHVGPDERIVEEFADCVAVEQVGTGPRSASRPHPHMQERGQPR